ncbi:solute carrier family 22 member 7-like [Chlorella sorokiniana]|uniref:Solute carrier family 22 member 7-like n=1 Tax=Chlorella sorokiniana TaxID=3076 RepID=A0A2P6U574_CHLSO|nr:solute carrier family 22 member 7-like [Chlorella sorokiniana]|eukprot:PRW61465.1 solute carrier family 22 member 7-like [Chlorella sorokiniana]
MASAPLQARAELRRSLHLKEVAQARLVASQGHVLGDPLAAQQQQQLLQQELDSCKADVADKFSTYLEAVAEAIGLDAPEAFPGPPDSRIFAGLPARTTSSIVQLLWNMEQWESHRRAVAACTISGRWPVQGGWWRYKWSTWALLALLSGVAAALVVLCVALPADQRWTSASAALGPLVAVACGALAALAADNKRRRQDATNAIKNLNASAQAAEKQAERLH